MKRREAGSAPRSRDPEGSRERIVQSAIEVFARKGFHDALVEEITRASNVSKGAFYLHFPTKQAMFLELLDGLAGRLTRNVNEAMARESGSAAQLEAALRTILHAFASHRSMARLVLTQAGAAGRLFEHKLLAIHGQFAGLIRGHIEQAIVDGEIAPLDAETVSWIWFGAINEIVIRWLYTANPPPLEDALPALRSTLLRSIGFPEPQPAPQDGHGT